jgi:hypothetical protein
MMGQTRSAEGLFHRLSGFRSNAVVRLSYSDRTGKLQALLDSGRPAFVDIGRQVA